MGRRYPSILIFSLWLVLAVTFTLFRLDGASSGRSGQQRRLSHYVGTRDPLKGRSKRRHVFDREVFLLFISISSSSSQSVWPKMAETTLVPRKFIPSFLIAAALSIIVVAASAAEEPAEKPEVPEVVAVEFVGYVAGPREGLMNGLLEVEGLDIPPDSRLRVTKSGRKCGPEGDPDLAMVNVDDSGLEGRKAGRILVPVDPDQLTIDLDMFLCLKTVDDGSWIHAGRRSRFAFPEITQKSVLDEEGETGDRTNFPGENCPAGTLGGFPREIIIPEFPSKQG